MKPARIIVLIIAVVAGGIAALLAGRSDRPAPSAPAPVAQMETTDVLIAGSDIGLGNGVLERDLRWQTWPAAAAGANFIRRNERPDAIHELAGSIARSPFFAGEPVREAKLIKAQGSGFMAAILPSGKRAISVEISPETGAGGFILPKVGVEGSNPFARSKIANKFSIIKMPAMGCGKVPISGEAWGKQLATISEASDHYA
jgi:pilus assembly protein CpaB